MLRCLHASRCGFGALQCLTVHSFVASETACELFRLSAEAEAFFLKEACFDHIMYNYDTIRVPAHARWLWHERACSDRTPRCGLGSVAFSCGVADIWSTHSAGTQEAFLGLPASLRSEVKTTATYLATAIALRVHATRCRLHPQL
jgi:hypothetical protein